jgi:ribose 5-phosphate isomerase B
MKIHLATDHAGFEHKEALKAHLLERNYEVIDHGDTKLDENDDYPDYVTECAKEVAKDVESKAIIFGGSGEGEAMCANCIVGARAVVYYGGNKDILTFSRLHNNANILSIGARFMTTDEASEAVDFWLGVEFSHEERHIRRLSKF